MYEKLKTIELAHTSQVFGLAIAVLLEEGVKTISKLTDEEIARQKGNALISDEFWQTIIKVARSIATTIKDDPWVYDEIVDVYIDPPAELLDELEKFDLDEAEERLTQIANADPAPDWLFDKDYWYDGEI